MATAKKSNNNILYVVLGMTVIGLLLFLAFRNKSTDGGASSGSSSASTTDAAGQNCFNPPENWDEYPDSNDDVDYVGLEQGISNNGFKDEDKKYVHSFMKQIGVQLKPAYIKYFKTEIKAYVKSSKKLPHWDVLIGQLRCDSEYPNSLYIQN